MEQQNTSTSNSNEFAHLDDFPTIDSQDLPSIEDSDIRKIMSDNESADDSEIELPQPHSTVTKPSESSKTALKLKRQRSSAGKSKSTSKFLECITKMKQKKQKQKTFKKTLDQQLISIEKKRKKIQEDLQKLSEDEKTAKQKYTNSVQVKEYIDAQNEYSKHKTEVVKKRIHDNVGKLQKLLTCSVSNMYDPEGKFGLHMNSKTSEPEFVYQSHADSATFISLDCFDFLFKDEE